MKRKPEAVEAYLQRATRGLWGRKRQEVREELQAHLEERTLAHRIGGLPEQDAVEKALAELGSPQIVNTGMTRLYTLPTVAGSGLTLLALCLSVLAFWPQGIAQPALNASFYWPTKACVKAQQMDALYGACREFDTLWLEPESFKAEMRRQGVKVDEGVSLSLTFPDGAYANVSTEASEMYMDDTSIITEAGTIAFVDLFRELLNQPGTMWLEGWDNPVVHIGEVRFQLGTDKHKVSGEKFYRDLLGAVFFQKFSTTLAPPDEGNSYFFVDPYLQLSRTATATSLEVPEPGVYGIMISVSRNLFRTPWLSSTKPGDILTTFEIARADETGTLVARLPKGVKFATTLGEVGGNTAALVRFADSPSTKARGYSVVAPDDIALASNP